MWYTVKDSASRYEIRDTSTGDDLVAVFEDQAEAEAVCELYNREYKQ